MMNVHFLVLLTLCTYTASTYVDCNSYRSHAAKRCQSHHGRSYDICLQRRMKRSSCDERSSNLCGECNCNYCEENSCSYRCSSCCSSREESCDTPYCCHKKCHRECDSSPCRRRCRSKCIRDVEIEPPSRVISNSVQQQAPAANITTIISLHNKINNTNIIDMPIRINTTNVNNMNITTSEQFGGFGEVLNDNENNKVCCQVIIRKCEANDLTQCRSEEEEHCGNICLTAGSKHTSISPAYELPPHEEVAQNIPVPQVYPQPLPQNNQEIVSQPQPQFLPQYFQQPPLQSMPQSIPQIPLPSVPQILPQSSSQQFAQIYPQSYPQPFPQTFPQVYRQSYPQYLQGVPQSVPQNNAQYSQNIGQSKCKYQSEWPYISCENGPFYPNQGYQGQLYNLNQYNQYLQSFGLQPSYWENGQQNYNPYINYGVGQSIPGQVKPWPSSQGVPNDSQKSPEQPDNEVDDYDDDEDNE